MLKLKEIFELMTKNSYDCVFLLDHEANIVYCNNNVKTTFDFTPEELIGENFFLKITSPKYNQEYIKEYENLKYKIEKSIFELECVRKDGSSFAIESYASSFIFKEQPFCIYSIRDITERKIQEKKEKEYQELFFKLTDTTHDAIIWIGDKGNISYWNPAAADMFGYSFTEVYEKNLHDLIAPKRYHKAHREAFKTFVTTGKGNAIDQTLELEAIRRDGSEFPVELSVSAMRILNEWTAIAIIRDITDRKEKEKLRSTITTQFETIFNVVDNNVYVVDSERNLIFLKEFIQQSDAKTTDQKCYKALYNQNDICPWCPLDEVLKGELISRKITPENNPSFYLTGKPINIDNEPSMLVVRQEISE